VAQPVTMPQLGETVIEGTVTKWLKKEGETVARDEPLFEISTDKVDTEVPSPLAGTLVQIKVQEGETVSVGTELAMIDTGDGAGAGDSSAQSGSADAGAPPEGSAAQEAPSDGEQPAARAEAAEPAADVAASAGAAPEAPATPAEERSPEVPAASAEPAAEPSTPAAPAAAAPAADGDRSQILSPLVRRLAEANNVDLSKVTGTGTGGRIMKSDVEDYINSGGVGAAAPAAEATAPAPAAAAPATAAEAALVEAPPPEAPAVTAPVEAPAPAAEAAAPVVAGEGEQLVPLSRMRQAIAHHLVASVQTSARAWSLIEVDMENIVRLRNQVKDAFKEREGVGLTYMPFIAKAVCDALLAHPDVNAELRDDQLVLKRFVNLGIAVALEDGLIVPVVKGADSMSVTGLASAISDVAARARAKKLAPDDVHGSTFTITNPGPYGTLMSVPIINQPNCAILAFDTIEKRPVVVGDAIGIRHMVYLSMSWDHRIIDGATAAQFLSRLKSNLETWDFGPEFGLAPKG
jgi:pyruvate dehydrogenase E2 component (dihydrolipoyllysine-residue acetyltransferase)